MRMHDAMHMRLEAERQARIAALEAEVARLRAEVGRLRLTDAEREAVESAMDIAEAVGNPYLRNALRGLLARLGGGA